MSELVKTTWKQGEVVAKTITTEDKIGLTTEEKTTQINALLELNKANLDAHNTLYAKFHDTNLGSVITRIHQNIEQLKQIKRTLQEEE